MATKDSGGGRAQSHKSHREDAAEETEAQVDPDVAERQEELSGDVDDVLDAIDEVLEENAEEFVRGYVQKGGE